ncbi:WD40 repeat-like protein [Leucogyrophana mollusca]|uniref:WD40 repeat-like protein n=1 Tax=Leucogyrophana mollusca TaxID=85980 RepID=A0ACB8B1B0_9AGAM|nr:WD40 repeat-like protein [Leucogyrophana mollusca]
MSTAPEPRESPVEHTEERRPTKFFRGHNGIIWSLAYFPDGRRIASGSSDRTVRIWNMGSGQQEGESLIHDAGVNGIAISPDGRNIASRVVGRGVVVWDVARREKVHEVEIPKDDIVKSLTLPVEYSPDGRWIGAASLLGDKIHLWNSDADNLVREPTCLESVQCLAFSPNGSEIATGSRDGSFHVCDVLTGKVLVGPVKGHTKFVASLVYSPDGRLIITGSWDQSVRVWDAKTGQEVGQPMLEHKHYVTCLAVAVDGRSIVSGSFDNTVRVWDIETRLQIGEPLGVEHGILSVAFSPDGRFVVGGSYDGIVQLWDIESNLVLLEGSQQPSFPVVPQVRVTRPGLRQLQQKQVRINTHNGTSSLNSSVLDLPAVAVARPDIGPQRTTERAPSVDNDWDSINSRRKPTGVHRQEVQAVNEHTIAHPPSSRQRWTAIRDRWRNFQSRKARVHVDTPNDLVLLPPSEPLTIRHHHDPSTDQQAPLARNPGAQAPYTRIRRSPRLRTRFRRTNPRRTNALEVQPPAQHRPSTPEVVSVAAGRATTRLAIAPDYHGVCWWCFAGCPPLGGEEPEEPEPPATDEVPPSPSSVGTFERIEPSTRRRSWFYRLCHWLCFPDHTD